MLNPGQIMVAPSVSRGSRVCWAAGTPHSFLQPELGAEWLLLVLLPLDVLLSPIYSKDKDKLQSTWERRRLAGVPSAPVLPSADWHSHIYVPHCHICVLDGKSRVQ